MTERRRRFLLVSGFALVTSSVCGAALATTSSSAATPPTTEAPTPAQPTVAEPTVPEPTVAPPTEAPTTLASPTTELPTTIAEATTTTAAPTTTIEAAEPAAPSVAYAANAVCDPATGETTVSWKVTNNGEAPVTITGNTEDVPLEPNPVPPSGEATATRDIEGPATDQQVTSTVTIDAGGGVVIEESDDITAAACQGPETPPDVTFTFSVRPSVTQAAVGDTVEYVYCGQNTSTIPLQVGRVVDDRIGLVFEGGRVVAPGEAVCNTDVGAPFSYVVDESDAGSVIHNNAVITVRTEEAEPREFQQTATAEVLVPLLSAQPLTGVVTICHETSSLTNSFEQNTVSQSAVQVGGHHYNHEGDIIPDGPWAPGGRNWDAAGQAVWNNGCGNILKSPVSPAVVPASCVGGVVTAPTVTPASTTGIGYAVNPAGPFLGTQNYNVMVTATLDAGFNWGPLPAGWTQTSKTTARFPVTLTAARCDVVTPVAPRVNQAVCRGGVLVPPTLTYVETDHITYSRDDPGPYAPGDTVVVTATLTQGVWPPTLPQGWTSTSTTTATYPVTFVAASCHTATPADPLVLQSACVAGVVTDPSVAPVAAPGVTYAIDPPSPYSLTETTPVTVTATLAEGFAWVDPLPPRWSAGDPAATTAVFTVTLTAASCTPVAPADPTVVQAECVGGVVRTASVTPATGPTGVSYALGSVPAPGTTVAVTATVAVGYAWVSPLPTGWSAGDPATARATFTVTLAAAETCTGVTPQNPTVRQAVCVNGAVTTPTITLATTEGVSYALGALPEAGTTVTVTATVARGYAWAEPHATGWTYVNASTATFPAVLNEAETCTGVTPQNPTVRQAVCVNGAVTTPTITLATTEGVSYALGALPEAGTTVTVTATVARGYAWAEPHATGWTYVNASTATFPAVLNEAETCTGVTPQNPTVRQAVCVNGAVTTPTITLATTEGVSYALGALPEAGTTVTVTATVARGYAWAEPHATGWTYVNASTATFPAVLNEAETCTGVTPQNPTVRQAVCVNGAVTTPTITLATTEGVSYALGALPEAGTTVTVTATVARGYAWAEPHATGWTYVNASTATFPAVLNEAETCTGVTPQNPTVRQAVCVNGAVTTPTITLATTEGVSYALGALPEAGTTVTVTATVARGYAWAEPHATGWTYVNASTATFPAVLNEAETCTGVTPQNPTVRQAVCVNGAVTTPTITLATTEGVSYALGALPEAGTTVTVTATVARGYAWAEPHATGWTYVNASTATFPAVLNEAETCTGVTPQNPTVRQAVCVNGAVTTPTITLATTEGVSYALGALPEAGTTVTVTATVARGYAWAEPHATGWTYVNASTATFPAVLNEAETCTGVTPQNPTVRQAVCVNGAVTTPTITLATTEGVSYALGALPEAGTTVTVTATVARGYAWAEPHATGWTYVNASTATFPAVLNEAETCTGVTPQNPTVRQAVCVNGAVTTPTITLATTEGVSYALGALPEAGTTVTVTATVARGYAWAEPHATGWTYVNASTATFPAVLDEAECKLVMPIEPTLVHATCAGGVVTEMSVVPATGPTGVRYVVDPPGPFPGTSDASGLVSAVLDDGYAWGTIEEPWEPLNATTVTMPYRLVGTTCDEVTPVPPTVSQAVCAAGELQPPTLTLPELTDGISYTVDPPIDPEAPYASGQTVVVTATLNDTEVAWPDELPVGWDETSDTTATYEVSFKDVSCTLVTPTDPTVMEATCVNGDATAPTVTLTSTPGIVYAAEPPGPYDPTVETDVVVTATVIDGFAWDGSSAQPAGFVGRVEGAPPPPVELPDGWTWVSPTEATFDITLEALPSCPTIGLEAPEVVQADCVDGEATEPSIQPVETEGVEYEVVPRGPWTQGELVTITATITDPETGWADPPGDGWNAIGPATATYEVTFEVIECAAASSTTTSPSTTAASATTTVASASTSAPTTTAAPTTAPAAPGSAVITGNAVCALDTGQTTVTWTVRNTGGSPVTITGDDRGVSFTPTQLPANTSANGSEVIEGPAADEAVTESVSVDVGGGQTTEATATVTVPACTGPAAPDDIAFTFTNDASIAERDLGRDDRLRLLRREHQRRRRRSGAGRRRPVRRCRASRGGDGRRTGRDDLQYRSRRSGYPRGDGCRGGYDDRQQRGGHRAHRRGRAANLPGDRPGRGGGRRRPIAGARSDDNHLASDCAGYHRLELGGATDRWSAGARERWRAVADRTSAHNLSIGPANVQIGFRGCGAAGSGRAPSAALTLGGCSAGRLAGRSRARRSR